MCVELRHKQKRMNFGGSWTQKEKRKEKRETRHGRSTIVAKKQDNIVISTAWER